MALTLTVAGANFKPQYRTGSIRISAQVNNQGNTLSIVINQKSGQTAPAVGNEIILERDCFRLPHTRPTGSS